MAVHLVGMGWIGSVLAAHLDRADVAFTWADIDSPVNAWTASTGLVYPDADPRADADLAAWTGWLDDPWWPDGTVERCSWWYGTKHPPHGVNAQEVARVGRLGLADVAAIQVDVAAIVNDARIRHAARRVETAPPGARVVVAHGFGRRLDSYSWGWSVSVRLSPAEPMVDASPLRPAIVAHLDRWRAPYAYPQAGRPGWWWAGSSMIRQTVPRRLDVGRHYSRWRDEFARGAPDVEVLDADEARQGWRPKWAAGDRLDVDVDPDGTIVCPSLAHSGVRLAPTLVRQVLQEVAT